MAPLGSLRNPAPASMLALALGVLLVALSTLPHPSSAQTPPAPVLPTTFVYPCSGCKSCSNTGCSGCTYILNGTCSTNAGWCTGCSVCNGTACGVCSGIGFSLGCDNPEWYNDTKQRYEFVTFLFLAFLAVVLAWVIFTMCRRNKQHRQQLQQAQEMSAIQGDTHNPTYAHDPYGISSPDPLHTAPGSRPEAYSYYYASTAAGSQPPPTAAPSYPAPPPGYPGVHTASVYGGTTAGYGGTTATTAADPILPVSSTPAGFTAADQLTPLPVSEPAVAPTGGGSSGRLQLRRGGSQQRDQRQSLLSEDQRVANSSSMV